MASKVKWAKKRVSLHCGHLVLHLLLTFVFILSLITPNSAQTISLGKSNFEGASFLDDEAGIAAYMKAGTTIDLALAKQAYRTIEDETEQYIIGSVTLTGYPETEDVHAYVHKDGWIIAYYLNKEPAAKIVDWNNYGQDQTIKSTKLEIGIVVVCNFAGLSIRDVKYYHFKYPNANKLMIAADALWQAGDDTFEIKLPSDFVFYERSFSHYSNGTGTNRARMYLDENQIGRAIGGANEIQYGIISPTQLSLDEFHTVKITASSDWNGYGYPTFSAILVVYQQP